MYIVRVDYEVILLAASCVRMDMHVIMLQAVMDSISKALGIRRRNRKGKGHADYNL